MSVIENTQPDRGVTDLHSATAAVRAVEAAVKVLEAQRDGAARTADEMRADMRDARDRVLRLEMKVDALPTKDWIGTAVSGAIRLTATMVSLIATLVGAVITMVHLWH